MWIDKDGWPVERLYSTNTIRNIMHGLNYLIRCCIHGRKWVGQKEWEKSEAQRCASNSCALQQMPPKTND